MDGQFGAPPFEAFISEPKRQEVTVGDSVMLQCTIRNRAQVTGRPQEVHYYYIGEKAKLN